MAKVRDIMQKNVITVDVNKTALEAATILKEKDISFLVIVENTKPIGIVTERDFVRKIVTEDKQASKIPLTEIMSPKFRSVGPSTEIDDAVQKMLNFNIRRLLVLEEDSLVGVITQTDLTGFLRSKILKILKFLITEKTKHTAEKKIKELCDELRIYNPMVSKTTIKVLSA